MDFELRRQAWQASLKMQREETKDAVKTTTSTAYLSRALAVKTITNSQWLASKFEGTSVSLIL